MDAVFPGGDDGDDEVHVLAPPREIFGRLGGFGGEALPLVPWQDVVAELERLQRVSVDRLREPSSCAGWSIYDLINHVNGGGHRYWMLLQGADALADTRTQDHVESNPAESFWYWQKPLAEEFATEDATTRIVHHPVGDRSGQDLLGMWILDLTLHAWDLARCLQMDEHLDPGWCNTC